MGNYLQEAYDRGFVEGFEAGMKQRTYTESQGRITTYKVENRPSDERTTDRGMYMPEAPAEDGTEAIREELELLKDLQHFIAKRINRLEKTL